MRLAIYGYGDCALGIAPWARALGHEVVFVSDGAAEAREGDRIVALADLDVDGVVVAVALPATRRRLVERVEAQGLLVVSIFAPTYVQRGRVVIDEGCAFSDHSIISGNVTVGRHCLADVYTHIGDGCIVGDFVTLSPRACLNGNIIVEDDVSIGAHAIIDGGTRTRPIRIGRGAIIGMGALIDRDVPPGARVVTC